jgi:hypothetical protein
MISLPHVRRNNNEEFWSVDSKENSFQLTV